MQRGIFRNLGEQFQRLLGYLHGFNLGLKSIKTRWSSTSTARFDCFIKATAERLAL